MFVEDNSPLETLLNGTAETRPSSASPRPLPRPEARRRQARLERPQSRPAPQTTANQVGLGSAIASFIRLGVLLAVGYVVVSLWAMPELKAVVVSIVRGERPDLQPLLARLADWLNR